MYLSKKINYFKNIIVKIHVPKNKRVQNYILVCDKKIGIILDLEIECKYFFCQYYSFPDREKIVEQIVESWKKLKGKKHRFFSSKIKAVNYTI